MSQSALAVRHAPWPLLVPVVAALLVSACGGDDDAVAPLPAAPQRGVFQDVPVSGLDVGGSTRGERTTGADGAYTYDAGETLSFAIGALALGSAPAGPQLTVLGLTPGATGVGDRRVTNKLILLQTLDADGDLNNGIQITAGVRSVVSARAAAIVFDQPSDSFRTSLAPVLAELEAANAFTDLDPRPRPARTAVAATELFARATAARHTVTTTGGTLVGFAADADTWQFLGVPYARPPVGELRWKPPVAPAPWTGVRQAVAWSDQSAQTFAMEALGEGGMSEDSLYLNVTAPKNASKAAVMVWFHGGAFAILTGNSKQYNNPAGPSREGVVVVTVNHRLGAFGYMGHPLLTAESGYGGSGNYGQMDLVMALNWVKANIAQFGGDPGNVTIFGQSGGGGKTYSLMNSPQAKGLFHKAIVQSGASAIPTAGTAGTSLAAGEALGTAMFARAGVTTLAQARALPWTAFVQADQANNIPRETYRPNADNFYLPKTYQDNVAQGMPSDVPLMVGATDGDYPHLKAAMPVFMAQRSATYASPQYVYKFSRVPDGWKAMGLQSGHGGEIPYLFNFPAGLVSNYSLGLVLTAANTRPAIGDLNGNGVTGSAGDAADVYASMQWGAADVAAVDTTMALWTSFAKTGKPAAPGFEWPAYTLANDTYVEIGGGTPVVRTGLAGAYP